MIDQTLKLLLTERWKTLFQRPVTPSQQVYLL